MSHQQVDNIYILTDFRLATVMTSNPMPPKIDNQGKPDLFDYYYNSPGSAPGTLSISPHALPTEIILIDYNRENVMQYTGLTPQECIPYLDTTSVSWIDVRGLGSENVLRELGQVFHLPLLVLEDIVNVPQRPKIESYPDFLLIITQMANLKPKGGILIEQVSFILGKNYLLTIQEEPRLDSFEPVRWRIHQSVGFIRQRGADYLAYALTDAIVDHFFPVLEHYGEKIEEIEEELVEKPTQRTLGKIYRLRRELLALRRAIWPQRDLFNSLIRDGSPYINPELLSYWRDCYDHTVQLIDILENYHELASGLMDVYLSVIGNKMNEIMKFLTIISTIFIPLTFIVGVYGMNFNTEASPFNMPELNWYWGYLACWIVMITIAIAQLLFFWRRGWFKNAVSLRRK